MNGLTPLSAPALGTLQLLPSGGGAGAALDRLALQSLLEATLLEVLPEGLRLQLPNGQELLAQGQVPYPPGSLLALRAQPLPGGAGLQLQILRATPPPTDPILAPLAQGEAGPLLARLQAAPEALRALAEAFQAAAQPQAADSPQTWTALLKAVLTTLSNPALSPREAPFHQLQAQDGTALFEVPLPWAPAGEPLRLWVEADATQAAQASRTHRVFLSVPFSTLGPVRLGVERGPAGFQARIWLQEPSRLEALRPELESGLAALGAPANVRLLPLPDPAPDLRALAGAPPLAALG
ncbi:MAG: hypothetical protein KGI56_00470 [Acidobacteriota bacterium]|nr:hypothetical protein [Acidobacteriota bacterium]